MIDYVQRKIWFFLLHCNPLSCLHIAASSQYIDSVQQRNYKEEAQIGKSDSLLSIILTILKLTFRFISIKMYNTNTFSSFLSLC